METSSIHCVLWRFCTHTYVCHRHTREIGLVTNFEAYLRYRRSHLSPEVTSITNPCNHNYPILIVHGEEGKIASTSSKILWITTRAPCITV